MNVSNCGLTILFDCNESFFSFRLTFRELHTAYGRPILKDRNEWRYQQKQEQEKDISLITL